MASAGTKTSRIVVDGSKTGSAAAAFLIRLYKQTSHTAITVEKFLKRYKKNRKLLMASVLRDIQNDKNEWCKAALPEPGPGIHSQKEESPDGRGDLNEIIIISHLNRQ